MYVRAYINVCVWYYARTTFARSFQANIIILYKNERANDKNDKSLRIPSDNGRGVVVGVQLYSIIIIIIISYDNDIVLRNHTRA